MKLTRSASPSAELDLTLWITDGILKSINSRKKMSRIDSVDYIAKKTDFNKYRNTLSKAITNAKRINYNQIFDRYKYDIKKPRMLFQK